jgi:hypothetical protein
MNTIKSVKSPGRIQATLWALMSEVGASRETLPMPMIGRSAEHVNGAPFAALMRAVGWAWTRRIRYDVELRTARLFEQRPAVSRAMPYFVLQTPSAALFAQKMRLISVPVGGSDLSRNAGLCRLAVLTIAAVD